MKRPEQTLHIQVANYLRVALLPPTFWTSIEHAARLGPVAAAMRKARGVKAGLPDILILHAGKLYGLELKSTKGRASPAQNVMRELFNAAGAHYEICYSLADVDHELYINSIPRHASLGSYR